MNFGRDTDMSGIQIWTGYSVGMVGYSVGMARYGEGMVKVGQ